MVVGCWSVYFANIQCNNHADTPVVPGHGGRQRRRELVSQAVSIYGISDSDPHEANGFYDFFRGYIAVRMPT